MAWLKNPEKTVLKRTILRDEVKDFILEAILNGDLKPEERVVETQIANSLGISQAPVREALRELEHMGALHTVPYKGSFVRKLTPKELNERAVVRASLEQIAVQLVIPKVNDAFIKKLEVEIGKMIEAAKQGDSRKTNYYNVNFHRLIVKKSGNEFLLSTWESTNPHGWTTITAYKVKDNLIKLAERHYEVLEAIKTKDPERASKTIFNHIVDLNPEET